MARILLAEDDKIMSDMISDNLLAAGYRVEVTHDGLDAHEFVTSQTFDLLILDWDLPGMTGLEVCRVFRQLGKQEPVLFLTGKSDISDKEMGLYTGADDYVTKPFDMREFMARVKVLLRRPASYLANEVKLGDVTVDLGTRCLSRGDQSMRIQPREFALLEFFIRRPGQVLGTEALLSGVWGADFEGTEIALRSCLAKLRKALSSFGHEDVIQTVHGFGYRLQPPE